jgi:hypothetical protein
MPALHQVLTEKAGGADAEAQGCGEGSVVGFRLGGPCVHGAERQEDRSSDAGQSQCGFRQVGLLTTDQGARWETEGSAARWHSHHWERL